MGAGVSILQSGDHEFTPPKPIFNRSYQRLRAVPDELIDEERTDVASLQLSHNNIHTIHDDISELIGLRYVDLSNNKLTWISYQLYELPNLTYINVSSNYLEAIDGIGTCTKLKHLDLCKNRLSDLDSGLFSLSSLRNLLMADNKFDDLPQGLSRMKRLCFLDYNRNSFKCKDESALPKLPKTLRRLELEEVNSKYLVLHTSMLHALVSHLSNLQTLNLRNNHLDTQINEDERGSLDVVAKLSKLVSLNAEGNGIKTLPDSFGNLSKLETCVMSNNEISELPTAPMQSLTKIKHFHLDRNKIGGNIPVSFAKHDLVTLSLANNNIRYLPKEIAQPTLQTLCCDNNQLTDLNQINFGRMKSLRSLSIQGNAMEEFPATLHLAQNLEVLNLAGNKISHFPDHFRPKQIKKVNLSRNRIKRFPKQLLRFEDVDLSGNCIGDSDTKRDHLNDDDDDDDDDENNDADPPTDETADDKFDDVDNDTCKNVDDTTTGDKSDSNTRNDISKDVVSKSDDNFITNDEPPVLKRVNLADNEVSYIPLQVLDNPQLEELHIGGNHLKTIPKEIVKLTNLQILGVQNNQLVILPSQVFQHPTLREVEAKGNKIHTIVLDEEKSAQGEKLQKLDVSDNRLRHIPKEFQKIQGLKEVDVSDNQLYFFPTVLENLNRDCGTTLSTKGNLLRDVHHGGKENTYGEKRGKMFLIGARDAGKATLMKALIQVGKAPERYESDCHGREDLQDELGKKVPHDEPRAAQDEPEEHAAPDDNLVPRDQPSQADATNIKTEEGIHTISNEEVPFMDRAIWVVDDNIDVEVTYCGGKGKVNEICPAFFTEMSMYVITFDLGRYNSSENQDGTFRRFIGNWIKMILSSIGGEVVLVLVGTHSEDLTDDEQKKACKSIRRKVEKLLGQYDSQRSCNSLASKSPLDVITLGKEQYMEQVRELQRKLCNIFKDEQYGLLPLMSSALFQQHSSPATMQMKGAEKSKPLPKQQSEPRLKGEEGSSHPSKQQSSSVTMQLKGIEKLLLEMRDDDDHMKRIALTEAQFEEVVSKVGLNKTNTKDVLIYLKHIGVIQHYERIPNLKGYIFHNIDFLRDIVQAIFENGQHGILDVNTFPPGYRDVRFSIVKEAFDNKAILSEDVIRECVLGHLSIRPEVMSLVLDVLIGLHICYDVSPDGNEGAFLHGVYDPEEEEPPRIIRFPGYLKKRLKMPGNFIEVFETSIDFPWFTPSRLKSMFVCMVHNNVKEEWVDGFHCIFSGVSVIIMELGSRPKKFIIKTRMEHSLEHTYDVLNREVIGRLLEMLHRTWPHLMHSLHMKVVCPANVGCKHPRSPIYHKWKPYPKDNDQLQQILDECDYRKEGIPDHIIARRMIGYATDLVCSKLDPTRWKDIPPHIGIPEDKVGEIMKKKATDDLKLKMLLEHWKDRIQTPGIVKTQIARLISCLKVIGEPGLANEVSNLNLDEFDAE